MQANVYVYGVSEKFYLPTNAKKEKSIQIIEGLSQTSVIVFSCQVTKKTAEL
jgi:hypothetical protein